MFSQIFLQINRGGFLGPFDDKGDIDRQLTISLTVFLDGGQAGCDMPLVIIDPAAIHIALADIQLEGRAGPGLVRIRRLDIIVIVKNQGLGICLWTSKSSQQKGSCIGFIQNDLGPSLLQDLLEIAGCSFQTCPLGKNTGQGNQLPQNGHIGLNNCVLFKFLMLF